MEETTQKRYRLSLADNNIYLTVEKGKDFPFPSKLERLMKELAKRKIMCQADVLKKHFGEATGEQVQIATCREGMNVGPLLDIALSPDFVTARLQVFPSLDQSPLTVDAIREIVKKRSVKHGLKTELFEEIVAQAKDYYQEWVIAEGRKPQPGQDATIKFLVDVWGGSLKPKELENGTVDFYNLNLINIVDADTVLAEKIPPTPGMNGMNVFGQEVRGGLGKDVRLPVGVNTKLNENQTKLLSTVQGHVCYTNGRLNVYPTYEVRGDVDFKTGNIKFPGNVVVRGNVNDTFIVEAGGDVEVFGILEGTVITEGNLKVHKGIVRGKAKARGSIFARNVENGELFSSENIEVGEAIMHSTVKAGKKVVVNGRKGLIVGGKVSAGQEIQAKNIGAAMGTITHLEVGVAPELREEYKSLSKKIKTKQQEIEQLSKSLNVLDTVKATTGALSAEKEQLYQKMTQALEQNKEEVEATKNRLAELEAFFFEIGKARIRVMNTIHYGVDITIGRASLNVNEEEHRVEFRLDDDYEIRRFTI